MGAANALAAYTLWPDLPHRAHRLLAYMALRSLDDTTDEGRAPRLYFGGPDALAEALGYDVATPSGLHAGLNAVAQDLRRLVRDGAIERVERGRNGHRAVYRLRLDVLPSTSETVVLKDQRNVGESTSETLSEAPANQWPLGEVGTTEDNGEDKITGSAPHLGHGAKGDDARKIAIDHAREVLNAHPGEADSAMLRAKAELGERAPREDREIAAARYLEGVAA